jgi:hypothetical protein
LAVKRSNAENIAKSLNLDTHFYNDIKELSSNIDGIIEDMEIRCTRVDLKKSRKRLTIMVCAIKDWAEMATYLWDKHYKEQTSNNKCHDEQ